MYLRFLFFCFIGIISSAHAQDTVQLRNHINALCAKGLLGRGYVGKGMQKAGRYITQQYKDIGLQSFTKDYAQPFFYPVNTFPGVMDVKIDDVHLTAGEDYLVHPASNGIAAEQLKLRVIDGMAFVQKVSTTNRTKKWDSWLKKMTKQKCAYLLTNLDTVRNIMGFGNEQELLEQLPPGVFLVPGKGKPMWSVAGQCMRATVIELYDTALSFHKKSKWEVTIVNQQIAKFTAENIVGYVPGTEKADSFIVITAHYDHLGKMGNRTMFPGASDNASGTAMLLALADFYRVHPQKYSIAFMAFAGEEAGLKGSEYYTTHPLFPLTQIRFLINLDILGDATEGITVVNGSVHQKEFDVLSTLNQKGHFLPEVKVRGAAANSDHYPFSEKGVPAFFFYTNGGNDYYHDIWDKAENVSLKNIPALGNLINEFVHTLQ